MEHPAAKRDEETMIDETEEIPHVLEEIIC